MSAGLDIDVLSTLDAVLQHGFGSWETITRDPSPLLAPALTAIGRSSWRVTVRRRRGHRAEFPDPVADDDVAAAFRSIGVDPSHCSTWWPYEPSPGQPQGDDRPVYFIQADNGLVKIGVSDRPKSRLATLRTMSPVRLCLLGVIPGLGVTGEHQLHQRFAASRSHGEWFRPTQELAEYIVENARPA